MCTYLYSRTVQFQSCYYNITFTCLILSLLYVLLLFFPPSLHPSHFLATFAATHESNGLHIITALILSDINPLAKTRMDLVLELKNNASKLLLAIMESRADSENAERILQSMHIDQLVSMQIYSYPMHLPGSSAG